jgi:hypothetical protein
LDALLGWLPFLGCAAMMFVCLRHMAKASRNQRQRGHDASTQQEMAELREEVARLRAERSLTGEQEPGSG